MVVLDWRKSVTWVQSDRLAYLVCSDSLIYKHQVDRLYFWSVVRLSPFLLAQYLSWKWEERGITADTVMTLLVEVRDRDISNKSRRERNLLISFPDLLWTKPKARSGQIRFALRDRLSGMWQARQERMPKINSQNGGTERLNLVPRVSHLTAPWSERRETLVGSGHVPPRIWEMTIKLLKGWAA